MTVYQKEIVYVPVYESNALKDKCAVVTGGTSGIGFAIAKAFLKNGCKKVLITSRSQNRLDEAVALLKQNFLDKKDNIVGALLDLNNNDSLANDFATICEYLKEESIDIWVNNAGVYYGTKFGTVTDKEWNGLIDVNLKSQFFLCQLIANYMVENHIKGNICNICSSSSFRPSIDPYMISKLGLSGLTLGMAKKLITEGIVVNGIAPGPTFTPMLRKKPGDDLKHGGVPAGRYVLPEEVANLAVFLTSSMGRMIVGDVVKITGGSAVTTFDDVKY